MDLGYGDINWLAILACVVAGQVILTIWFVAVFGEPWAAEYGATDKAAHTAAIPSATYAIGAGCVLLLSIGIALFQHAVGADGPADGIVVGLVVAVHLALATALPGYAFLQRYRAFGLAMGAQVVVILAVSIILSIWT